jgi:transcriptional regulator with PAS, ATPase and Fis domain
VFVEASADIVAFSARPDPAGQLIGQSREIAALRQDIVRVARSDAKVLITGESGVGKEIVARAIHGGSARRSHAFAPVNCAGLPESLLESELFGHVKGSFTGAHRDKAGKLEAAHMGTVFLDEVGEMTPRMQGLLLRFLETGELQKVGGEGAGRSVDVRVVAATNRDLRSVVSEGGFREDLFYRLNVIHIVVPPLRERRDDIPILVAHFLERFAATTRGSVPAISPDAMRILMEYAWPGNVRELENAIERAVVTSEGATVHVHDLPVDVRVDERVALRPKKERRRSIIDGLYQHMREQDGSFWTVVYPLFMNRDLTRAHVREVVRRGLEEARGNYRVVTRLFNMVEPTDYKRFLSFLRKHDCHVPFKEYR